MKRAAKIALSAAFILPAMFATSYAQSTSQEFPTAISTNEVSGQIKARDIGDSRLTTYYYTFNGDQGDLFINLVTRNFTGDIDVFAIAGLRPLTKITVYADYGESETGRAIYLRKPEKILLRVQGRTPNDDEATFRLKFAGSFAALRPEDVPAGPEMPKVNSASQSGVRVNSVGTIIPGPPKAAAGETLQDKTPDTTAVAADQPSVVREPADDKVKTEDPSAAAPEKMSVAPTSRPRRGKSVAAATKSKRPEGPPSKDESAEQPNLADPPAVETTTAAKTKEAPKSAAADRSRRKNASTGKTSADDAVPTLTSRRRAAAGKSVESTPDPLASINLVIQFKNGSAIEKRLSEVSTFRVDKGVLTVVLKDGGQSKYQMVEVAKVTIE